MLWKETIVIPIHTRGTRGAYNKKKKIATAYLSLYKIVTKIGEKKKIKNKSTE